MNSLLKTLPAVDRILSWPEIKNLILQYGLPLTKFAIKSSLQTYRKNIHAGGKAPGVEDITAEVEEVVKRIGSYSLKPVLNGTGIVLHTNLGRAPLGDHLFEDIKEVLTGYNNLEFDLETAKRGDRYHHASKIIKFITGAEDILIVNNNAAALLFILTVFAKNRECIVSRGELVEIGGSFRLPEVIEVSGSIIKEVGTTNKTKISDYSNAITDSTAALLKVHKSNFVIKGFTQECSMEEVVQLGKKHHILTIFDAGSGLIKKCNYAPLKEEPTVREAIESGVDLVCFSADKLFGACQAGIIAGKSKYLKALKKHPMLRALRVCKTTIAILEASSLYYLRDETLYTKNPLYNTLHREASQIKALANSISEGLSSHGIDNKVIPSHGQFGGGAMPDTTIESFSVVLTLTREQKVAQFAKKVHLALLQTHKPLLTNLSKERCISTCSASKRVKERVL